MKMFWFFTFTIGGFLLGYFLPPYTLESALLHAFLCGLGFCGGVGLAYWLKE